MATSRLKFTATQGQTTAGVRVDDQAELTRKAFWHAFVSWTGTAPTSVQIQYAADIQGVLDSAIQYFSPTALLFTAQGDTAFWARPTRFRVVVVGGDGTTVVTAEIR